MALKLYDRYNPLANPPTAEYPTGSIKNRTAAGIQDGTPMEKDWANDLLGMRDAILAAGNVQADGSVEDATSSQVVQALRKMFAQLDGGDKAKFVSAPKIDDESTDDRYARIGKDNTLEKDLTVQGDTTLEKDLTVKGYTSFDYVPKVNGHSLVQANWLGPNAMFKANPLAPIFKKTGSDDLSIKAGTVIALDNHLVQIESDTPLIVPTLDKGTDYAIWINPDLSFDILKDEFDNPSTAPDPKSRRLGGFHYGLVDSAETVAGGGFSTSGVTSAGGSMKWAQDDVDRLAGVNEFSIWDVQFRCAGEQRGLSFSPLTRTWWAIYFMSTNPDVNGPSRYNTDVASGTVLPYIPAAWGGDGILKYAELRSWEAHELCSAYGLRLPTYEEFMAAAFGVTEAQSLGGSSTTIPATKREPGYTSRIGLEQATGHQWIHGAPIMSHGGSAYSDNGRGAWYGEKGKALFGGRRTHTSNSGSRAAHFGHALSHSGWNYVVRAAGDHLNPAEDAR